MKKQLFLFLTLIIFTLVGCSNDELSDEKPPTVTVKLANETHETKLGTYCWKNGCVDTAGPVELLEGTEPIKVKPDSKITFSMDFQPKPTEFHLLQISEENENEITIENNSFLAPTNKGVYYYSFGVWWMDAESENVSNGDAFYSFSLEVEQSL